jgi:aldose 1-epimerase
MPAFVVADGTVDGHPTLRMEAPESGLSATYCPRLGMVGCSLGHLGAELLGQRKGLAAYEARGSTMGIPLLHPWANRLSGFEYTVSGRRVELDRRSPLLHLDPSGLPIHGLLAASPYWSVVQREADDQRAEVAAELDYAAHPDLLAGFPFPHKLRMTASVDSNSLLVTTLLTPNGDTPVPVSFGYHPYLTIPDAPRATWEIELPPMRRMLLDSRMIPTGEAEPAEVEPGPLGGRTFDDAFSDVPDHAVFRLAGAGRTILVEFLFGYPFAQLYAPPDDDVVCFEPMTAPTNALVTGSPSLRLVQPGDSFEARFRISVSRS